MCKNVHVGSLVGTHIGSIEKDWRTILADDVWTLIRAVRKVGTVELDIIVRENYKVVVQAVCHSGDAYC